MVMNGEGLTPVMISEEPVLKLMLLTEIHIVKHLEDKVCSESQNVTFDVEVSHSGIDPVWTFRNQQLKPGPKHNVESKGKAHSLTLIDTMKDEEGQYMFHAGQKTSIAQLTVSGRTKCCGFICLSSGRHHEHPFSRVL